MRQANLTTNHIANMGKGKHISMASVVKICETLNFDLAGVIALTGQLKAAEQLKWVGLMNAVKAQVEEIIFTELVYR